MPIFKEYYSKLFNGELECHDSWQVNQYDKMAEDNLSRTLGEEGIISVSFNSIVKEDFDE